MKKILILLFLIMFLTGCSAEVNIIINDTGINESIMFRDSNVTAYKNNIPVFYDDIFSDIEPDVKNEGVKYYNKSVSQDVNGYKINYSYKYTIDEYKKSRSVKGAFRSFNIRENNADEEIVISTDSGGLRYFESYMNLDSVKINITPSYKVLESNADYVSGNVYTWVYSKNTKKHIYMKLDNPSNNSTNGGNTNNSNNSNDSNNSTNNDSSSGVDVNNDSDSNVSEEKKDKNEKESFLEKYPYIVLIGCIVIFLMFVIILVRVMKTE